MKKSSKRDRKAFFSLREEIVEIVETAVVKVLNSQITPEIQTQLIDQLLGEAVSQIEAQMELSYEK
jgi:ethanolamine utilization protein EutQ (cupin superfamily)